MPLPFILGAAAAVVGIAGAGTAINGAVKMKDANDTMEEAQRRQKENMARFERKNKETTADMDKLGKFELEIMASFKEFSHVFEQIKNRPEFGEYSKDKITLPKYDGEELKKVSVGAGVLLGGLSGAAVGTAGGFAAAGATTAAVMALGTASTGTAIASLSGAAATNAALAALGGGAITAGGGGIALGTTILGATTLGVGLLVGGVIFNFTGSKLSDKADEAWSQMKKEEEQINKICNYLLDLRCTANAYCKTLSRVNKIYKRHLDRLESIVRKHTDWKTFTPEEKELTENTVLLVGLLFEMCKVKLVLKSENKDTINRKDVEESIKKADAVLADRFEN